VIAVGAEAACAAPAAAKKTVAAARTTTRSLVLTATIWIPGRCKEAARKAERICADSVERRRGAARNNRVEAR
jgi:hypothetical protein